MESGDAQGMNLKSMKINLRKSLLFVDKVINIFYHSK